MVERVSKAILETPNAFDYVTLVAKNAIHAMFDPTEEMLNAARDWSREKYGKPIGNEAAIECFHAMIEGALK